ncbi:hypothetical protein HAX54_032131 [Datura stramonium]|uniref:Uncharacterized protein n=1 Tax=Datura stramonium TaxID=4076 RepID=A0ABS8SCN6_DATST|nr:hypothetical protein [Datura stramonium]
MSLDPTKLPDPLMPSYTFTVYHRDVFEKSKFEDYDSLLESRLARCHARANYLASLLHKSQNGARGGEMRELVPKSTDTYYAKGSCLDVAKIKPVISVLPLRGLLALDAIYLMDIRYHRNLGGT